jgi:hypothetical protein
MGYPYINIDDFTYPSIRLSLFLSQTHQFHQYVLVFFFITNSSIIVPVSRSLAITTQEAIFFEWCPTF